MDDRQGSETRLQMAESDLTKETTHASRLAYKVEVLQAEADQVPDIKAQLAE